MARRIVFPSQSHGPYVISAALLGAAVGFLHQLLMPIRDFFFPRVGGFYSWELLLAALLAIAITVTVRKRWPNSRWRFALGAAVVAGVMTTVTLFDPFNGAPRPTIQELASGALPNSIFAGLIGGLISLGLFTLSDAIFGAPHIQDGSLCVYCAYTIYGLPEPRCPECGQTFTNADIDPTPEPASPVWKRLGVRTAGVSLVGLVVFLVFPQMLAYALVNRPESSELALVYLRLRPQASVNALRGYLEHRDDDTRALAAYAVGCFSWCPNTVKPIVRRLALSDPDPKVRQFATQSLGWVDPELLRTIIPDLLRDSEPECRWMALASASPYQVGVPAPNHWVIPYLIDALDDADATNRGYVYSRLLNFSGKRFPFLPNSLRDSRLSQQAKWRDWWNAQVGP